MTLPLIMTSEPPKYLHIWFDYNGEVLKACVGPTITKRTVNKETGAQCSTKLIFEEPQPGICISRISELLGVICLVNENLGQDPVVCLQWIKPQACFTFRFLTGI